MRRANIITFIAIAATMNFCGCKSTKDVNNSSIALCGNTWELKKIYSLPIDSTTYEHKPYIIFNSNGTFSGNFGCNSFFGSFYTKKQKLQLEYAGSTKSLCNEMNLERAYLKALKSGISTYNISDSTLILYTDNKEIFQFKYLSDQSKHE